MALNALEEQPRSYRPLFHPVNWYNFQVEVTHQAHQLGLSITETPIVFVEREEGVSKMSWSICWEAITGMWRLRNKPPTK